MSDRYTKVILTVIAACLVWICVRDVPLMSEAYAQSARAKAQRAAREREDEQLRQSDKDKIEEAMPVKIVGVDEALFRTWPKSRNLPVPLPSFVQGGHLTVDGRVEGTPY